MRTLLNFPWKNSHLRTTSSEKHKSRRRSLVRISPERLEERSLLSTGLVAASPLNVLSCTYFPRF